MKLAEIDAGLPSEIEEVDGEVFEDDEEESCIENDLNTALELLERYLILTDDIIEDRLQGQNRIAYKVGKRIQELGTEAWNFLQQFSGEVSESVTVVDLKREMVG